MNWMKQLSHHKLSSLAVFKEKWCAIIDITIKKGRAKLLSILRVPLNIYDKRAGAIRHNETEILAIFIKETWNGEEVAASLNETFLKYGSPNQIIFDQGSDLNCGVNLLKKVFFKYSGVQVVHDITHLFSNLLKNEYNDDPLFKYFMKKSSRTGSLVRQTILSKITPPKLRRLGRFHSIIRPIEWGLNAIQFYKIHKRRCKTKFQKKLKKSLSWLPKMKNFLDIFYEKCEL